MNSCLPSGNLFHIDFGFILGADPKIFPPPFKLTTQALLSRWLRYESSTHVSTFRWLTLWEVNTLKSMNNSRYRITLTVAVSYVLIASFAVVLLLLLHHPTQERQPDPQLVFAGKCLMIMSIGCQSTRADFTGCIRRWSTQTYRASLLLVERRAY